MKTITGYVMSPVTATVDAATLEEALAIVKDELRKPKLNISITQIGEDIFIPNPDFYSDAILETMKDEKNITFSDIHDEKSVDDSEPDTTMQITAIRCNEDGEPHSVTAEFIDDKPVYVDGDLEAFKDVFEDVFGFEIPETIIEKREKPCCTKEAFPTKCKNCGDQCKCGKGTKNFNKDKCTKGGDKVKTNKVKTCKCNKNTKAKKSADQNIDKFIQFLMGQLDK